MNDDMNQRARAILSERSGAAYQFDWDIQVISLVAAEKAITSAREEALREAAEKARRHGRIFGEDDSAGDRGTAIVRRTANSIASSILSLITGGGERG